MKIHWQWIVGGGVAVALAGGALAIRMSGHCPFAPGAGNGGPVTATTENTPIREEENMNWMTNFKAARELAEKEHKIMLLSFSGSDWCPWCVRLDNEVLAQPEFQAWAAEHAISVKLDFPQTTALPADLRKQNDDLAGYYNVEGFPTIILAHPDGREFARTGYRQGGAAAYVQHLEELRRRERKQ